MSDDIFRKATDYFIKVKNTLEIEDIFLNTTTVKKGLLFFKLRTFCMIVTSSKDMFEG